MTNFLQSVGAKKHPTIPNQFVVQSNGKTIHTRLRPNLTEIWAITTNGGTTITSIYFGQPITEQEIQNIIEKCL